MLYIRTDINDVIATGHLMRCLSIADAAKDLGEDTTFLLADEQACEVLRSRGYAAIVLHTRWNEMEGELETLKKVIEEWGIESILIDSYQVTESYLKQLTSLVHTTYMDDLGAFDYPVNTVVCYANYWRNMGYGHSGKDIRFLLGTEYVPLRKEFINREKKQIRPQVENLLLMTGGTDRYDVLGQLMRNIEKEKYRHIDVICGMYDKNYDCLCQEYACFQNIHIHRAVKDIEKYMKKADLVFSAGGTTLYELCAVGTPAISYAFADNQLENVKEFHRSGIIDYAGDIRCSDVIGNTVKYLAEYHNDKERRETRSLMMQRMVDGRGAERIVRALTASAGS